MQTRKSTRLFHLKVLSSRLFNQIRSTLTVVKSETFALSETEALGEDPSSDPSRTGDGGCGGST